MKNLVLIAFGGAIGSICRYLIGHYTARFAQPQYFPLGTLSANLIGCLLVGLLYRIIETRFQDIPELKLLLLTGFLGGFTTFSAFGLEIANMLRDGLALRAIAYVIVSVAAGLTAVLIGMKVADLI